MAAAKFNGGIGKATMHVVRLALASPDQKTTMADGHNAACSVDVDEALVAQITDFQIKKGIAKRTDATKRLIEIGLIIVELEAERTRARRLGAAGLEWMDQKGMSSSSLS